MFGWVERYEPLTKLIDLEINQSQLDSIAQNWGGNDRFKYIGKLIIAFENIDTLLSDLTKVYDTSCIQPNILCIKSVALIKLLDLFKSIASY